jgi:hypothetical protein
MERAPAISYTRTESPATKRSSLATMAHLAASENRGSPFKREGRKFALPLDIRGYTIRALTDTGSDIDAIDVDLIDRLGLQWRRLGRRHKTVRLGDGSILQAIGKVSIRCTFTKGDYAAFKRTFIILPKVSDRVQLIIGRNFLSQTQTLTRHQDRLEEIKHHLGGLPTVMNMSVSKRRFACYIDSTLALATADTGSDINLIKEKYAIERGFDILPVAEEEKYAQLPEDRVVMLTGKVKVRFDTLYSDQMVRIEPETSGETTAKGSAGVSAILAAPSIVGQGHSLSTFYVLPSLTSNIFLSGQFLDSIDAFDTHSTSFVDFKPPQREEEDLAVITWFDAFEKKLRGKSKKGNSWPPASFFKSEFNASFI